MSSLLEYFNAFFISIDFLILYLSSGDILVLTKSTDITLTSIFARLGAFGARSGGAAGIANYT